MAATHLGLISTTNPGSQTSASLTDGVTHSIVKTMTHAEAAAPTSHPRLGYRMYVQNSIVILLNFTISYEAGNLATVTYNYGRAIDSSSPESSGGGGGGTETRNVSEFFDLDVSMEQLSILRHPRYAALTESDKQVLGAMIQMGVLDGDNSPRRSDLSSDNLANECADKIEKGKTSYLAKKYIWKHRRLNASWTNGPDLGKIAQPTGPAPSIDGNWLFVGLSGSGWSGGAYEMTATWESSPDGDVWDQELYDS